MSKTDQLSCLEVRGGNIPADVGLITAGLSMHVISRPFHDAEGGGDVHYISSCGTGRITRLMVADVAGHGADVNDVARVLHRLMRRYVNHIDPRRFVQRMNDEFSALTKSGQFATAIIASYYAPTRRLSLINAGHPPALLYRAATRTWSLMEEDDNAPPSDAIRNIPLGIQDQTEYEQFNIELAPGDAVICYTDSLPESRDSAGELLGYQRILSLAKALDAGQPLTDWINEWLAAIDALSPGNLLTDDLTILLIRATGKQTQAPLHWRLAGMTKMFLSPFIGRSIPWPEFTISNLGGAIVPWLGRKKPISPPHR